MCSSDLQAARGPGRRRQRARARPGAQGGRPPPDVPVAARHGLQALDLRGRHGAAGALWDVWSAKSKPALRRYLEAHLGEFRGDDGELLAPGRVSEKQKQSNGVQAAAPANPALPCHTCGVGHRRHLGHRRHGRQRSPGAHARGHPALALRAVPGRGGVHPGGLPPPGGWDDLGAQPLESR